MAITMLLGPEMKHMGGHHVIIYAADVEPPSSCSTSLKGCAARRPSTMYVCMPWASTGSCRHDAAAQEQEEWVPFRHARGGRRKLLSLG